MMKRKFYLSILIIFIIAGKVHAQFTVTGEIRPRAEFRNGFKTLNNESTDPAFFIEQRSRLYLDYKNEKFVFRLTFQDIRLWGENPQIFKADNALFNVHEAWGQYNFSEKSALRVGRQELDYDNARFLGNLAWAQQSRSHDLAKFTYDAGDLQFHVGAAFNQEDVISNPEPRRLSGTLYATGGNYKTMQFAWFHKDYEKSDFSLLFLNNGVQSLADSSVNFSQTLGFIGKRSLGKINLEGELYYQFGNDPSGRDLSAYLASLSLKFKAGLLPITIGADILSGTDPGSSKSNAFTPLYGTNHKFYGFMDYFYVGNGHGNVGLRDFFIKSKIKTGQKSGLIIHLHEFLSNATIMDGDNNESSSVLGTEIDLVYNLDIAKEVNFKLGYSQLFASDSMEIIKGGDKSELNNWAWAMLTIKPVLFKK
ncbi:alginate export family protein [Fulvivirgaceae bacterium BMA12]|uniref:Alginate export family protein n=1 Tax=Agaribacillus aureus TaxID=3051825 RepID=A0ABT8LC98_9BACT|nr:alginate export family protein [Fulvivirgaceae bacterium BMA12]